MFELYPGCLQWGLWSDRHGITEHDPMLAFSRTPIDPGDLPQERPVPEYDPQIPSFRRRGAAVQGPGLVIEGRCPRKELIRVVR